MLRLIGFFFAVLIALRVLQAVPGIGPWFHGFLGFWLVAIGLSWALSWIGGRWMARRRLEAQLAALGQVDNPHVRGKRGALLLAAGRAKQAAPELEAAVRGEPQVVEWRYRLGLARLRLGEPRDAVEELQQAERLDAEHAYGGVQLALARAEEARGEPRKALEALERFEQSRGSTPQSAYLRGVLLRRAGRADDARESFANASRLLAQTPKFQRKLQGPWAWRARLARLGLPTFDA